MRLRANAGRWRYMQSLPCLLMKKRFAVAKAAREEGGGVLTILRQLSVRTIGCLMGGDDPVSLSNAEVADGTGVERFPGERARARDGLGTVTAGPRLSRPGGGRHSTSNQLSLRLLDALEWLGDRQGALDKS